MKKFLAVVLAMMMVLSLAACGSKEAAPATSAAAPAAKKTFQPMTIGGADSTGTMYAAAAAIATTISNATELTISASTSSGSNENALKVHTGEIELGMCTADAAANAWNGKGKFADTGKCEDLRYIGAVYASTMNWVALKSSGCTWLHDLNGKKAAVGTGPAASSTETCDLLTLKYAGVTDYVPTACTLGDAADGVCDGIYVAGGAYAGAPVGVQLTASVTKDCVWLGMTDDEINALIKDNPAYVKAFIQPNTYNGQKEAVPTIGVNAGVICNADLDDDAAYLCAKALYEQAADMVKGNAFFADLNDVSFLVKYSNIIPMHPGAEKFYKEVGLIK